MTEPGNSVPQRIAESAGRRSSGGEVEHERDERQRAEAALKESQRALLTLMSNLPGMAYRCRNDADWTMEFVSEGCLALTGYGAEDLIDNRTLSYAQLIHSDDRVQVWNGVQGGVDNRGPFTLTYRIKTADGQEKWVWEQGRGVFSVDGELLALEGFITDITPQMRDREALQASEQRYRDIVEGQTDLVCSWSPDGSLTFVNEAYCTYCGRTRSELIGRNFMLFIHDLDREGVQQYVATLGREKPVGTHEHRVTVGSGEVRWEQWSNRAILDPEHGVVEIQSVGRDVTERRRAEEILGSARDELKKWVDRRTAELTKTNERLQVEIAERERVEHELRESSAKLARMAQEQRTLLQNTRDFLYRHDTRGVFNYLSPAVEQITGYTVEEWCKHYTAYLTDNPINDKVVECTEETLRTGKESAPYLVEIAHRNGSRVTLEVSERPYFEGERVAGIVGVARDVTERVTAEEALRDSERQYRTMFEVQADAVVLADLDGSVVDANPAACALFGYTPEEFAGLSVKGLIHPDDRHLLGEAAAALSEGRTFSTEGVNLRKDGTEVYVEVRLSPFEYKGKLHMVAVVRDVTERRRAEKTLRESEEGYRTLFEQAPDAVVLVDSKTGGLAKFNDKAHKNLGYTREEFEKLTIADLEVVESSTEVKKHIERILTTGADSFETKHRTKDGAIRDVLVHCKVISAGGKELFQCVWSDITDLKRGEEELREAKEAAEAANRAKSVFLANLSHEIRTPIAAVLGAAELLSGIEADHPELRHRLDMILRNGRHLLSLVDDLLDLSRADAGRLDIQKKPCSLVDIIVDTWAVTEPLHHKKNVDFRVVYESPIPVSIRTDPTRLKQAIINLVNNALKFTSAGHVWVRVSIDKEGPEPYLSVVVEDTGVGIPSEHLRRIFEAFAQVAAPASSAGGGVGLGLPLAKWIAKRLQGELEVTSEEGRGSVFTLRVPIGPIPADVEWLTPDDVTDRFEDPPACDMVNQGPTASATEGAKGTEFHGRLRGKILFAEDFRDVRELIARALTQAGADLTVVEDGEQALKAASEGTFDLILMDIRMTKMDGITATAELRRRGCLTPIIALTASTGDGDRERFLQAGFDDYWRKPLSLKQLVESAAAYLETVPEGGDIEEVATAGPIAGDSRMAEAIAEFVSGLEVRMSAILDAVESGDLSNAGELLHQLAGAGGIHGFMSLSDEAGRLLTKLKDGSFSAEGDELHDLVGIITSIARGTLRK